MSEQPEQQGMVEAAKVAALVKLTTRRLNQLAGQGWFPPSNKGKYGLGPTLVGLVNYYRSQAEKRTDALAQEELRYKTARADVAEIERDKRRGKLIELKDAEAAWDNRILSFRSRALSVPLKAAPLVLFQKSQQEVQQLLHREVGDCLQELSRPVDYKQATPEPLEDDEPPESSAT